MFNVRLSAFEKSALRQINIGGRAQIFGRMLNTFGRDDGLEAGGEELEELEVVDLGAEVAHPHRVVLLPGQHTVRIVVQLEPTTKKCQRPFFFP